MDILPLVAKEKKLEKYKVCTYIEVEVNPNTMKTKTLSSKSWRKGIDKNKSENKPTISFNTKPKERQYDDD